MENKKYCNGCKKFHPIINFTKNAGTKDGLEYFCKEYSKIKKKKHKEQRLQHIIEYISADLLDKIMESTIKYPDTKDSLIKIKDLEKWNFRQLVKKAVDLDLENFPKLKENLLYKIVRERPELFTKFCNGCKYDCPLPNFHKNSRNKYEFSYRCRNCENNHARLYSNTVSGYILGLVSGARRRSKDRNATGRKFRGSFELTTEYITTLMSDSPFMKILPNLQLFAEVGHDWQITLDRIDDDEDYTIENTRFAPLELNGRTKWTEDKLKDVLVLAYSEKLSEIKIESKIEEKYHRRTREYTGKLQDDEECIRCRFCGKWTWVRDMHNKDSGECKLCRLKYTYSKLATLTGKIRQLSQTCRGNAKKRSSDAKRGECDLDFDDLLEIYREQGGLCYYSGIPFQFGLYEETWWIPSAERLDVSKGYVKDNVVLVCLEFNTQDYTNNRKYESQGSGAWNKEKFKVFYKAIEEYYGENI